MLLAMITLGLVVMSVLPGLKGMISVGKGTSAVLNLLDLRERLAELIFARVGAVPELDCSPAGTGLQCSALVPYGGEPGGALVDKMYLVSSGVIECVASNISQAYVVVTSSIVNLNVSATMPSCSFTTGYYTLVAEVVVPPVTKTGTVTFAVTHPPLLITALDDVSK